MFITLEGIEGSGKTSQIKSIAEYLAVSGYECVVTREPGATAIGRKIRSILLDPASERMDSTTELLLYMADRVQHVREIIVPALSDGKMVLCDRFYDATVVYQGVARGIGIDTVYSLHKLLLDGIQPDVTFLLDLPPEEGLARAWRQIENGSRTGNESRFERETLRFHEKVRAGYLKLAHEEPDRFRIVDAMKEPDAVQKDIVKILAALLD